MKKQTFLEDYWKSLPESMNLKKKVIKTIMKSEKPITQKEILDLLDSQDWTNVKRVLQELRDTGLIVKTQIGKKEYFVKVNIHKHGKQYVDGNRVYFYDVFEPDYEDEEKYVRIKQMEKIEVDKYMIDGMITIRASKLKEFIDKLKELPELIKK